MIIAIDSDHLPPHHLIVGYFLVINNNSNLKKLYKASNNLLKIHKPIINLNIYNKKEYCLQMQQVAQVVVILHGTVQTVPQKKK